MVEKARENGTKLLLPVDILAAAEYDKDADFEVVNADEIPDDRMGLDIGPETARLYCDALDGAKTIVWNGPMGVFEFPKFAEGTKAVAKKMADSKNAVTIIGGGDSAAAVNLFGLTGEYTHVSTGGGASLVMMEGAPLPAIEAADDKD